MRLIPGCISKFGEKQFPYQPNMGEVQIARVIERKKKDGEK